MARPKKLNADYFSHDADMRNDPKLKALRRKFGIEGYAIWNMMLEILTDSDDFEYEWSELNIELLSGDFDVEPEFLKDIINYCFKLKLLQIENDLIFSQKMKSRFETLLNKRKRDVKAQKKELSLAETQNIGVIASEKPQSKVKENKVNENKVNEKRERKGNALAFDLLKAEKPEALDAYEMQNKKQVEDWGKLIKAFNNKMDLEIAQNKMKFDSEQLLPRFRGFSDSWIDNQDKYSKTPAPDSYESGKLTRF